VAGFDPTGGAGVTADVAVFAALGAYGTSVITALTVQSTVGVERVEAVVAGVLGDTLRCLAADMRPAGVKIGMLGTGENARVVDGFCHGLTGVPVVLDTVLRASSGGELLDGDGVRVVRERLLGTVCWVTPNTVELGVLTGMEVRGAGDVPAAAKRLQNMAREVGNAGLNVVVTGGHLAKPDDYLLDWDGRGQWVHGERVETRATHGTGCAFSSALLAGLVLHGDRLPVQQVRAAKEYVQRAMETAPGLGGGKGPMNLMWPLKG